MDTIVFLAKKANTSAVVRISDLASEAGLSRSAAAKALRKQARLGILEPLADGVYLNTLAIGATARDVVNELAPESCISLRTALANWGLSTQAPIATTCVTISRARTIKTRSLHIEYRHIKEALFWGFTEKKTSRSTYRIAEPEKALLDWIYLNLKDGLPVPLDEIQLEKANRTKLIEYARKYPSTVLRTLLLPLAESESYQPHSQTTAP